MNFHSLLRRYWQLIAEEKVKVFFKDPLLVGLQQLTARLGIQERVWNWKCLNGFIKIKEANLVGYERNSVHWRSRVGEFDQNTLNVLKLRIKIRGKRSVWKNWLDLQCSMSTLPRFMGFFFFLFNYLKIWSGKIILFERYYANFSL